MNQVEFVDKLIGEPVIIAFLDGKTLTGTLKACDTYTLLVRVAREGTLVDILVYKHAVRYIATVGD